MALDQKELQEILSSLKNNTRRVLDLFNKGISDAEMLEVSKAIRENRSLEVMNLGGNPISFETMKELSGAIKLHKNVKLLDLSYHDFGDKQATLVADAIMSHPTLLKVNVQANAISDAIDESFVQVVKTNNVLRSLDLSFNQVGYSGGVRLNDAIQNNDSLLSLDVYEGPSSSELGESDESGGLDTEDEGEIYRKCLQNCEKFEENVLKTGRACPISYELLEYVKKSKDSDAHYSVTLHDDPITYIGNFQRRQTDVDNKKPIAYSPQGKKVIDITSSRGSNQDFNIHSSPIKSPPRAKVF